MNPVQIAEKLLLAQHTAMAVLAVGLRQKALLPCFLIATTASTVFSAAHSRRALRSLRRRRVNSRPSAVKKQVVRLCDLCDPLWLKT
jgi:hypothetical protein